MRDTAARRRRASRRAQIALLGSLASACLARPAADRGPAATPPPADPPADRSNLLANPGFEAGAEPWWFFDDRASWGGFTVTETRARSGRRSARLDLLVDASHPPAAATGIRGVIQEVRVSELPARVSGSYFVERWRHGEVSPYVQFVAIAMGAPHPGGRSRNTQIRYLLAGIDQPPFGIGNAKFVFLSKEPPPEGRWISFERDLRADFVEQWGALPARLDALRLLFEVRYDGMSLAAPSPIDAVVHFDDLFLERAPRLGRPLREDLPGDRLPPLDRAPSRRPS